MNFRKKYLYYFLYQPAARSSSLRIQTPKFIRCFFKRTSIKDVKWVSNSYEQKSTLNIFLQKPVLYTIFNFNVNDNCDCWSTNNNRKSDRKYYRKVKIIPNTCCRKYSYRVKLGSVLLDFWINSINYYKIISPKNFVKNKEKYSPRITYTAYCCYHDNCHNVDEQNNIR